jgi:hypothetical protein
LRGGLGSAQREPKYGNALYLALDLDVHEVAQSGAPGVVLFSPLASIGYQAF